MRETVVWAVAMVVCFLIVTFGVVTIFFRTTGTHVQRTKIVLACVEEGGDAYLCDPPG